MEGEQTDRIRTAPEMGLSGVRKRRERPLTVRLLEDTRAELSFIQREIDVILLRNEKARVTRKFAGGQMSNNRRNSFC